MTEAPSKVRRRLPKGERRDQLLATALSIVRNEGADRLTLGHLAASAGVSKPVAYDHFETRTALLIALYKVVDIDQVRALEAALEAAPRDLPETARILASAYIRCGADTHGDWQAVGAALAGSAEKEEAHRELLAGYVRMFADALAPHVAVSSDELDRRCIALIGAGEALITAMLRGECSQDEAAATLSATIRGAMCAG